MECSKCGAPEELAKLFDVISGEGIVKICQRCMSYESSPIIKKPTEEQIQSMNKSESLYKRLSDAAGIDPEEHRKNVESIQKEDLSKKQNVTLRDLVDKKFDQFVKTKSKKRDDLIDNFHWIIMRARRAKKFTVSQLAKELGESEKLIKFAEQGVLPENDYRLIEKFEKVLGINILKPEIAELVQQKRRQLGFDKFSSEELTISDLQEMKKEDHTPQKTPYWKRFLNKLIVRREKKEEVSEIVVEVQEDKELEFEQVQDVPIEFDETSLETSKKLVTDEEQKDPKDLSQKDMDDIIFGRK